MPKGTPFSGEFRQKVVEDVLKNKLSYKAAMRKYGIAGDATIQKWERIYLEQGAGGLYVDHRGRASAASGTRKGRPPKLGKKVEEDLIAENQRLERKRLPKIECLGIREGTAEREKQVMTELRHKHKLGVLLDVETVTRHVLLSSQENGISGQITAIKEEIK